VRPFKDVIDGSLLPLLGRGSSDDVQVLVRYRSFPIDDDISLAERMGLEHIASMRSIPVVTLRGDPGTIERLSGDPRVAWIEHDDPVELEMEQSLMTINATLAWDTWVVSARREFPQVTGEGITVAVVDTGIDAGHPDLDYGEKTIVNLKSDIPGGPWREMENSDTSYGHGTHCAGTIAGNGDASAGARKGVAPDAKLIGLCVGDVGITLTNTLQGLDWVYENSKPPNPYNIKVVSNSWGGGAAEYDPEDATSIICQKLTYENNVLVVFAMGNAGQGQHSGETLTASPTGLIPSNIGVAAFEHDGSGVATFSSRGEKGKNQTYPDIGAPGVRIWSAHARATEISMISKLQGNPNPYYLAISGTSMATPHVSGLAALMFQAAPSLRISDRWEDYSGDDPEGWHGYEFNRIHEIEWIMEQSAHYLGPDGIPLSDEENDNGVPEPEDIGPNEIGWDGRPIDWAQGYGIVDAQRCVGIALALQNLRDMFPDQEWTPKDAIAIYDGAEVFHAGSRNLSTDTLYASWSGEFARYAQDRDQPILVQNQTRLVYVPEGASEVTVLLQYDAIDLREGRFGDLTFTIDYGWDGSADYDEPFFGSRTTGTKEEAIPVDSSNSGMFWAIGIYGRGFKLLQPIRDGQYFEMRVEYSLGVTMKVAVPEGGTLTVEMPPSSSMLSRWSEGSPSPEYAGGVISLTGTVYDVERMRPLPEEGVPGAEGAFPLWIVALLLLAGAGIGAYIYIKRRRRDGR
jgi:serine protease AprX